MPRQAKRGPKPKDRAACTPLRGRPVAPSYLGRAGIVHFEELVALIEEAGLLSQLDADGLALYCSLWVRWRQAEIAVAIEGEVITAINGYRQKNPWLDVSVQCLKDMRVFLNMFGLSPAARNKLTLGEVEEVDPKWAEFKD